MYLKALESMTLLGNPLIDVRGMAELFMRFGVDVLVVYLVIGLIVAPRYRRKSYTFSYFMINICVFMVCILLNSLKLKIGFAFGLFAIFSILRYRTEPIPIREMTYFFVTIIIGVINALSVKRISYGELLLSNAIIVGSVYWLEAKLLVGGVNVKRARYEKIELIAPKRRHEMIADIHARTGLDVTDVDIEDIDFLNDTANVKIYYRDQRH